MTADWRDVERFDAGLRAYIANRITAELTKAGIDVHTLKLEHQRQDELIQAQARELKTLRKLVGGRR